MAVILLMRLEDKPSRWQVLGTQYNKYKKFAMVFVTLNKSDKEYSPSTLYEDYAISQSQFHWQSMNKTQEQSEEGQRIINQKENGWKYVLFVRDSKTDEFGNTNGYYCLGMMDFNSSHGECPMNVVWDMHEPIPGFYSRISKSRLMYKYDKKDNKSYSGCYSRLRKDISRTMTDVRQSLQIAEGSFQKVRLKMEKLKRLL